MPLPKPLKKTASKAKKSEVVGETLHDLKKGPHHKDRTHKQELAIAMKQSGQAKKGKPPASKSNAPPNREADAKQQAMRAKKDGSRRPRNKGRS